MLNNNNNVFHNAINLHNLYYTFTTINPAIKKLFNIFSYYIQQQLQAIHGIVNLYAQ